MSRASVNGVSLEYETFGPADGPAIVLIMGLGMQLVAWPDAFCQGLAARGFRVVRFDNRDIGLSTRIERPGPWRTRAKLALAMLGLPVRPPYTLDDMAADTLGLMDALGLPKAHLVGASMGGMIAQIVAARAPGRVKSLTSMMSTSGRRDLPKPRPEVLRLLARARPKGHAQAVAFGAQMLRAIGSPGYPAGEAETRAKVEAMIARAYRPLGFAHQLLAIAAAPSRVPLLRALAAPTLVLHGADDPLVPLPAGEDTAASIPGAKLRVIAGWGHDLPDPLLPVFVDAIGEHCAAAERA